MRLYVALPLRQSNGLGHVASRCNTNNQHVGSREGCCDPSYCVDFGKVGW